MVALCLHEHRDIGYSLLKDDPSDDAERIMKLDYIICESGREQGLPVAGEDAAIYAAGASYGVKITKTETGVQEEKFIGNVTCSIEKAGEILRLLADNCVTPCCLREVLEEICAADQTF